MKVEVIKRSDKRIEDCDYRDAIEINVNGKRAFSAYDGEPEDANLSRDFSDIHSIPDLMARAYEAGKNGEPFEISYDESDDI